MKCLKEGRGTQGGGETGTKLRASLKHAQWHSLKGKQQRSRLKDVEEGENTEERRGWRRGERLGRDTSSRQSALRLRVNILPTTVSDNIFRRKSAWVLEFTFIADERQAQARLSLGAGWGTWGTSSGLAARDTLLLCCLRCRTMWRVIISSTPTVTETRWGTRAQGPEGHAASGFFFTVLTMRLRFRYRTTAWDFTGTCKTAYFFVFRKTTTATIQRKKLCVWRRAAWESVLY